MVFTCSGCWAAGLTTQLAVLALCPASRCVLQSSLEHVCMLLFISGFVFLTFSMLEQDSRRTNPSMNPANQRRHLLGFSSQEVQDSPDSVIRKDSRRWEACVLSHRVRLRRPGSTHPWPLCAVQSGEQAGTGQACMYSRLRLVPGASLLSETFPCIRILVEMCS